MTVLQTIIRVVGYVLKIPGVQDVFTEAGKAVLRGSTAAIVRAVRRKTALRKTTPTSH